MKNGVMSFWAFAIVTCATFTASATFIPVEDEPKVEAHILQLMSARLPQAPSQVSEEQFNHVLQQIQQNYQDTVRALGGSLFLSGSWKSETPNAYARQMFGAWMVQASGGLARRPEMTVDGFTLVLCHELGHHLGGYAFTSAGTLLPMFVWSANEGQADYYATHVCARKLWAPEKDVNASFRTRVNSFAMAKCDAVWSEREDRDLCYRITVAAEAMANTLSGLLEKPYTNFATPDTAVVKKTDNKHPAPQCRLDTAFQGALCTAKFNEHVVPGKKTRGGTSGIEAEKEAAQYSCTASTGYTTGLRPACWFKPRL